MGLLNLLKSMFGGGGRTHGETFRYRCRECNARFESTKRHVTRESCPRCDAEDVRPDVQFE